MTSYKKILVAMDIASDSKQVLDAAVKLAKVYDSEITVLHVTEHAIAAYGQWATYVPPVNDNEIKDRILVDLKQLVTEAGLSPDCIEIDFGRPIDVIVQKAKDDASDLIVIGSHGRHGVRLLLGSTANGVLHHAGCDVLSIRIQKSESE